ncbi:MAG: hypothetical protein GWN00_21110 [Aliifodinibius sp.]|nr:hypothetical protein [Fodinibius sp.]NIY27214.1 hypothetical protein [Fodinibius sp.]
MYTVYKGRDNTFTVQLLEDEEIKQLTGVSSVSIIYKGTEYSSDVYGGSFDFSSNPSLGYITFKLGNIPALPEGRDSRTELIVYDPSNTNGVYWGYMSLKVTTLS